MMTEEVTILKKDMTKQEVDKLVNEVKQSWLDPAGMKEAIKRMISHQIDSLEDYMLDCEADEAINAGGIDEAEHAEALKKQYEKALKALD
ncbi:MAG TPA: hypothetical protein K8V13_16170 [Enterobacter roggenkampii]|nr:hypothetical protein [Enterobacter roggenkampii]